ncbi:hypothetical protein AMATHDRAFT_88789 [Amanita thiersii Skay4041]|uniref:Uncharacterized protein n=1 Tax=Amanita thiersii Skay4041 TaxID=703135 RepID=A0A2A9NCY9_9AGAR|nr:hypothetical protein AMATHDRAFT_88789 [Amanita thiersii Skay4041]
MTKECYNMSIVSICLYYTNKQIDNNNNAGLTGREYHQTRTLAPTHSNIVHNSSQHMRQLTLHASALNDSEYDLYTSSLNDIALQDEHESPSINGKPTVAHDDAHYERMTIGVREVRAWLRGRYSHVPATTIDAILKLFSPLLSQTDVLSGGQFFAALRLVVHIESGQKLDRSLAFVQAHPTASKKSLSQPDSSSSSRIGPPLPPPPPPSRRSQDTPSKSVTNNTPPPALPQTSSPSPNNPFSPITDAHSQASYPQPPQHPLLRVDPTKPSSDHSSPSTTLNPPSHSSHNPFAKVNPPLPPRKPPPPVPPSPNTSSLRHVTPVSMSPSKRPDRSLSPTRHPFNSSVSASAPTIAPQPPPKPTSHVTSTLMQQSLQASKVAQSLKKAEEQLEKERILQVLKSSSATGTTGVPLVRTRSSSPAKVVHPITGLATSTIAKTDGYSSYSSSSDDRSAPPLPRRRVHTNHNHPSPPTSTTSFEQVALSGLGPRRYTTSTVPEASKPIIIPTTGTATSSPSRMATNLPPVPPPTHPDRERDKSTSRRQSQSQMQTVDTRLFDSVYCSRVGSGDDGVDSPLPSPSRVQTVMTATITPPTPDSPVADSPTSRVFRSRSVHYPTTTTTSSSSSSSAPAHPPPIPPPLRRKRPESVQVLPSTASSSSSSTPGGGNTSFQDLLSRFNNGVEEDGSSGNKSVGAGSGVGTGLSRHLSLSSHSAAGRRAVSGIGPGNGNGNGNGNGGGGGGSIGRSAERRSSLSTSSTPSIASAPAYSSTPSTTTKRSTTSTTHGVGQHHHYPTTAHSATDVTGALGFGNLHRTLTSALHPKLEVIQPRLEKARFKAEAGLSRRGFVRDMGGGEEGEGLVAGSRRGRRDGSRKGREGSLVRGRGRFVYDEEEDEEDEGGEEERRVGVDSLCERDGDGRGRCRMREREGEKVGGVGKGDGGSSSSDWERDVGTGVGMMTLERDNLKWPVEVGEGWERL